MIIPIADADVAPAPTSWENGCCIGSVRLLMLLLMKWRNHHISRMRIDLVDGNVAQGHSVAVVAAAAASGRNHVTGIFIGSTSFVHLAAAWDDQRLQLLLMVKMSMRPVGT
jgi:hypothetical protein